MDYLIEQLFKTRNNSTEVKETNSESIIEQAKAMHKEEIEDAYCKAGLEIAHNDSIKESGLAQLYFNETFGETKN